MEKGWTRFGWHGITALIPSDWELSGLSGDYSSGYMRIDDQNMPRLEIKWSKGKSLGRKNDLHRILDEYFKMVRKSFEKRNIDLKVKRELELIKDESFFKDREVVFFSWKADIRANGAIWHCKECNRIVIVQISGTPKEPLMPLGVKILASFHDHPCGHNTIWTAYGLEVEIPRKYKLDKHKLMSAYILLSFTDGSKKLAVERYGLANILLKETNLEEWFRKAYKKSISNFGFSLDEQREEQGEDHKLIVIGQETKITDRIPISAFQMFEKIYGRSSFVAHVWHCLNSNRIFVVHALSKTSAEKTAAQVAESIKCH